MIINKLHVRNIGLFSRLNVEFNDRFNFITGSNASGKTSILRYISLTLGHQATNQFRYRKDAEVWVDFSSKDNRNRVGYGKNWASNYETYQSAKIREWVRPETEHKINVFTPNELDGKNIKFSPLFISAFRKISYVKIKGMTQEQSKSEQLIKYRRDSSNLLNGTNMPSVKQWLINRYFQIEKTWAINEKRNWDWLKDNISDLGPTGANLKFIEIKRELEPMFSVYGKDCYLEELSSGYQSLMSTVFCIIDWIEGTNDDEKMLVENATGTVLIDELDAHLHPEWQLTIRNSLEKFFPKLQFIITTHSPHLIASAKPHELLILPEHNGELELTPSTKTYSGWNTDQILEEIMGVKSLTNKTYAKLIQKSLGLIDSENMIELENSIMELKKVTHSSDTIVESLEIKLAALKLKQND